jgi:sterol 3beta-glucosyltransferase
VRIAIMSLGGRGDVQPALALAQTLAGRGHEVGFITHPGFATLAAGRGVRFLPLAEMQGELAADQGKELFAHGLKPIRTLRAIVAMARRYALLWNRQFEDFAAGSDCVVGATFASFAAGMTSRHRNVPGVQVFYQPVFSTRAFPSAFLPALPFALPGFANHATHALFNQLVWMLFRPLADDSARRVWSDTIPFEHQIRPSGEPRRPSLMAFSRHVVPVPEDWDSSVAITGYWFLERASSFEPPVDLLRFLEAGPPPVYVGFGSMGTKNPRATAGLVLDALARCETRAVLCIGWGGLAPPELPPGVIAIDDVPHDWLFPHMTAIVHHGGAGTTAAALRAGRPSVVVPFLGDQAFWARRVHDLGVAPRAVPYRALAPDRLAGAIACALRDECMSREAARLGRAIEAENGTARAADIIERLGAN